MTVFAFIFLTVWASFCSTATVEETKDLKQYPYIVIEPLSFTEYGPSVVKRVQETLNLTCTVYDRSPNLEPRYNITWTTPVSSSNSKNHVVIQAASSNSVNLIVPHLESRDEGEYMCKAQPLHSTSSGPLSSVVRVNIKSRKCGETMFACSSSTLQVCIPQRYKCDGHLDCQMGEDEDHELCGDSPCADKVQCEDPRTSAVRCIPKAWCCNVRVDVNCTTREPLSCCPPIFYKSYLDERSYYANHQPHMTDMTLLQTTVYTVIGCAMVFTIVVTVLVIAICRVHMKRSLLTQCTDNAPQTSQASQSTPIYDLDVYLNRGCGVDNWIPRCSRDVPPPGFRDAPPPGFLVTYNINNGVQIVGHVVDPPPYCEVISVPPKEGPPPPYTSREALDRDRDRDLPETEALLQQPSTSSPFHGGQDTTEACTEEALH